MSTSLQRIATGGCRLLILGVFLPLASDAWSLTISPSPSYTGNYTVSSFGSGCYEDWTNYPFYVGYVCTYLEERAGAGNWTIVPTANGATSWNATGKAPGTYTYQVYRTHGYGDKLIIDGPVAITVGTPPARDSLLTQLGYRFQARQGDINADGRTDLFVRRIAGGVAGNGVLDAAILRQGTAGLFSVTAPTAYETSVASSWPLSSTSVVLTDFNVDGFVDVELKGVAAATKVAAASDQIVFSSGVPLQSQPLGVRAVDAALKKFVGNTLDYVANPYYFAESAELALFHGTYPVYYCSFSWGSYSGILEEYNSGLSCGVYSVYVSGYYWDYSGFSAAAVAIWTDEQAFASGALNGAQSTTRVQQTAEGELGVQIGGWPMEEELGTTGEHRDANVRRGLETFWAILGIGRANAQEVETVEAPRQTPRTYGIVYVTAHHVFGRGPQHTALEFTSGLAPTTTTISAGPEWRGGALVLVSARNRASERRNMTVGTVQDPSNPYADLYFAELLAADSNYDDDLLYDAFPFSGCCFNSNGYTHGIVNATGGISSVDLNDFVGGSHPLPPSAFQ